MEATGQSADLADVQLALAAEDLRHDALGTDLGQVALGQMVLHMAENLLASRSGPTKSDVTVRGIHPPTAPSPE